MIEVCQISYAAGAKMLLRQVSLKAQSGSLSVIVGANGAGKSTLLKVISGEYPLQQGKVRIANKALADYKGTELARIRAVLSQKQQVSLPFLCEEIVLMGRYPHTGGHTGRIDQAIANYALDLAEVSHLQHRVYNTLSGGEQQRVQLARVLTQMLEPADLSEPERILESPRYLLLDEPINGLDLSHQHNTLELARSMARRGYCVIAVLHDLNLAVQYADHIVMMKQGEVVCAGAPSEVITCENIHKVFDIQVKLMKHPELDCPFILNIRQHRHSRVAAMC